MAGSASRARPTSTSGPDVPSSEPHGPVCTVTFCPICAAVTAGQSIRPEAVDHLLAAGREFLLAISVILGTRAEGAAGREPGSASLTRIDIE
jgi:hypothetical protein